MLRYSIFLLLSFALFACIPCQLQAPHAESSPPQSGSFVLVGGGTTLPEIRKQFILLAGGEKARIVLIPTACTEPDIERTILTYWANEKVGSIKVLHAHRRQDADRLAWILKNATGVWFSGGDQAILAERYGGTMVEEEIKNLYRRGGVVGGTSAGASIVSKVMVYEDTEAVGLGLVDPIVDQHFTARKRLDRLLKLLQRHPELIGIGIDEATAIIIIDDTVEVMGNGQMILCEHGKVKAYKRGEKVKIKPANLYALR